jgi:hypothetical protein
MAKPDPPAWRGAVNRLDRMISPRADAFVRTNLFADAVAAMIRLETQVRRRAERQTSRVWHLYNLPTATDVRRVRSQLSAVEARLRDLSERLEEAEEGRHTNGAPSRDATSWAPPPTAARKSTKPSSGSSKKR